MTQRDIALINAKYVASAVREDQYPEAKLPEIAFIGRSNVGKSSLINSLCNQRGLAKVSGAPGKTRTINYFFGELRLREGDKSTRRPLYLVDLPGYGFAKTGGKNRDLWSRFVGDYIQKSPRLALLCLLIDLRHPGLPIDREAYAWLCEVGVSLQIVGTKSDKLNQSEKQRNMAAVDKFFPAVYPVIASSPLKQNGRAKLLERLYDAIAEPVVDTEIGV